MVWTEVRATVKSITSLPIWMVFFSQGFILHSTYLHLFIAYGDLIGCEVFSFIQSWTNWHIQLIRIHARDLIDEQNKQPHDSNEKQLMHMRRDAMTHRVSLCFLHRFNVACTNQRESPLALCRRHCDFGGYLVCGCKRDAIMWFAFTAASACVTSTAYSASECFKIYEQFRAYRLWWLHASYTRPLKYTNIRHCIVHIQRNCVGLLFVANVSKTCNVFGEPFRWELPLSSNEKQAAEYEIKHPVNNNVAYT